MKALHTVSFILLVVGGLNWGLIGLGELAGTAGGWNVVSMILGWVGLAGSSIESIVYLLVGLSAVSLISTHKKDCRHCAM